MQSVQTYIYHSDNINTNWNDKLPPSMNIILKKKNML